MGFLVTPSWSDGSKMHTCLATLFAGIRQSGCVLPTSLKTGKWFDYSLNPRYPQIMRTVTMLPISELYIISELNKLINSRLLFALPVSPLVPTPYYRCCMAGHWFQQFFVFAPSTWCVFLPVEYTFDSVRKELVASWAVIPLSSMLVVYAVRSAHNWSGLLVKSLPNQLLFCLNFFQFSPNLIPPHPVAKLYDVFTKIDLPSSASRLLTTVNLYDLWGFKNHPG